MSPDELIAGFQGALARDDRLAVEKILGGNEARQLLLEVGPKLRGQSPLTCCRSVSMADLLIEHGASLDDLARAWADGFGAQNLDPAVGRHLVARGAEVSIHAAVSLGLENEVKGLASGDPRLITQPGGDGAHPLHFCRDPDLAAWLVEHGALIDARDTDHGSTPVQWRIGDAPPMVRRLVELGAETDIFLAAALGDLALTREWIEVDSKVTAYRIGDDTGPFPGIGHQARGGTIYQWTLGFNQSPHRVARERGHEVVFEALLAASDVRTRLLVGCELAERSIAEQAVARHPGVMDELSNEDLQLLAKFCWETNKSLESVALMLELGFPVDVPEDNHGFMALHNAAWCGDPELVALLLANGHPVDARDPTHNKSAIGWTLYSLFEGRRHPDGRFTEVLERLVAAGCPWDGSGIPANAAERNDVEAVLAPARSG